MAAWVMQAGIDKPQDLALFAEDGYHYDAEASTELKPDFWRARQQKASSPP